MALELMRLPFTLGSLKQSRRVWRIIRCFRATREELRARGQAPASLEELQYALPAERLGVDASEVRAAVAEWIHERPLRHLAGCLRPGLTEFIEGLRARRVAVGVFSDYPSAAKLRSLGLHDAIPLQLAATDAAINAFKPHPGGFIAACRHWDLEPRSVLYVGDRPEVDAAGARAAGMPCLIIGRRGTPGAVCFPSFVGLGNELERLLVDCRELERAVAR